jgi:hypothetical protein
MIIVDVVAAVIHHHDVDDGSFLTRRDSPSFFISFRAEPLAAAASRPKRPGPTGAGSNPSELAGFGGVAAR